LAGIYLVIAVTITGHDLIVLALGGCRLPSASVRS
jgi:hypothetical protein